MALCLQSSIPWTPPLWTRISIVSYFRTCWRETAQQGYALYDSVRKSWGFSPLGKDRPPNLHVHHLSQPSAPIVNTHRDKRDVILLRGGFIGFSIELPAEDDLDQPRLSLPNLIVIVRAFGENDQIILPPQQLQDISKGVHGLRRFFPIYGDPT